ncbi:DNA ligase [Paenibacillus popilliae ATCC 14706]|uniref:DNA ligase n=1 Tax=Paenibacillus popilliae ATCC 14706 TaxID=1212764 RepID=M9M2N8_PAEPP|nr:DNA ligase [Paenibacillus popilliae ATCC 14706]
MVKKIKHPPRLGSQMDRHGNNGEVIQIKIRIVPPKKHTPSKKHNGGK